MCGLEIGVLLEEGQGLCVELCLFDLTLFEISREFGDQANDLVVLFSHKGLDFLCELAVLDWSGNRLVESGGILAHNLILKITNF